MYSTRLIHLLLVAFSLATVTQAAWYNLGLFERERHEIAARQDNSSASETVQVTTSISTTVPTTAPTTTTDAPETTTSVAPETTTTTTPTTTTRAPTTLTTTTPTTQGVTTDSPTPSTERGGGGATPTTSDNAATTDETTATTETTATPSVSTTILVVTTTNAAGQPTQITSTSATTITPSASLNNGQTGSSSSGMSDETRNTIIGVCVGVGGAIVLAVVGLLFWRLRARKRSQEDNEDLVNYGAGTSQFNNAPEKSENNGSANGRTPFQSTLESYHAPTQTNAASNF
ncbi:uncharacterized protein BCR38DRAFT_483021 [Pseudomassariella vexata]|uniref:Mid2 domain-containing protein n=1 Tax=Pseudomassariella vexata TaxID=1141098 RepID=A0A1Y2E7V1_9PEZI|nr:uncharacterized protein BCR38DRAFT_483021 [Pseudomassariella vexata]ORY67404.1 hypothetical protein BCR38DRAFT_483021 [Pseudomassariella vexata]